MDPGQGRLIMKTNRSRLQHNEELGKRAYMSVFALRALPSRIDNTRLPIGEELATFIEKLVIDKIGMSSDGLFSAVWRFPAHEKGGVGFTHIQPIFESFIAWDTWSEHTGGYFVVFSCKEYEPQSVADVLLDYFEIVDRGFLTLCLRS